MGVLDLNDVRLFVDVVDRGGFTAAGRAREMPTSTVSHRISQLEKQLGLTLLSRTSRSVTVTDAGQEFYHHAVAMLDHAEKAECAMRERLTAPSGTVRYTVGIATAQFAMPAIVGSFCARFPRVNLVQQVTDQNVDLVAERFDVGIRGHSGPLPDSGLIQRPLAKTPWHLFASPAYLAEHGTPASPADLAAHCSLFVKRENVKPTWRLTNEKTGEDARVAISPRLQGACMMTLRGAAVSGLGIVALADYLCRDDVMAGRLQRILPHWLAEDARITALVSNRRGMSAATRAFVDHLVTEFPGAVRFAIREMSESQAELLPSH
jgi:DNA-binding transcriptional LysR family regulator